MNQSTSFVEAQYNARRRSTQRLRPSLLLLCASLCQGIFAPLAAALPDDKYQPVHIKSDSAERDERKGVTRYSGDVIIDQGSLHISAEEVIIYGKNEITRIVAEGTPAKLQQQPEPDGAVIQAHGNTIDYSPDNQHVQLLSNAWIEQDKSTVSGAKIDYYIDTQVVRANSSSDDPNAPKVRVQVIVPAAAKPQNEQEAQ